MSKAATPQRSENRSLNHRRQCSRRLALQALYQNQLNDDDLMSLCRQFEDDDFWPKCDEHYFREMVLGVTKFSDYLDMLIENASDYPIDSIDPVELAALRIAVFELTHSLDVPNKVLVAEAVQLCKKFGSSEGYKLVNAVLDKLIKTINRLAAAELALEYKHKPEATDSDDSTEIIETSETTEDDTSEESS